NDIGQIHGRGSTRRRNWAQMLGCKVPHSLRAGRRRHSALIRRRGGEERLRVSQRLGPRTSPRAEAHGRWRGGGGSRSGSLSVTTTHALFARKVQCKVSNDVAQSAAAAQEAAGRGDPG